MIGKYTPEQGKILLKLARESIEEEFSKNPPSFPEGKEYNQARGVFVTLSKKGDLRGCIGYPLPNFPVKQAIYQAAKQAAFSDPRFPPLQEKELKDIKLEISILTQPQEANLKNIEIGKDGLIANYLGYSGLLLPQVATENNFNKIQFLECLCSKTGIPKDSWQKPHFKLEKFQAQVFSE